jgi:TonB family protein
MESGSEGPGLPEAPRIVGGIDAATLARFYPKDAEALGIEGFVTVSVALNAEGRATDPQILSETPADRGFGAAASSLACTLTYSNPTGDPVVFRFGVKFELDGVRRERDAAAAARAG